MEYLYKVNCENEVKYIIAESTKDAVTIFMSNTDEIWHETITTVCLCEEQKILKEDE